MYTEICEYTLIPYSIIYDTLSGTQKIIRHFNRKTVWDVNLILQTNPHGGNWVKPVRANNLLCCLTIFYAVYENAQHIYSIFQFTNLSLFIVSRLFPAHKNV